MEYSRIQIVLLSESMPCNPLLWPDLGLQSLLIKFEIDRLQKSETVRECYNTCSHLEKHTALQILRHENNGVFFRSETIESECNKTMEPESNRK